MTTKSWIDAVSFNNEDLIPAIAQDKDTGKVLMMAWMNSESLALTAQTKRAVYYSRSRQKLWRKGETSGHTQIVHDVFLDCDADAIVLSVTQMGGIACHTGRQSCFYRQLDLSSDTPSWQIVDPILKDPKDIYSQTLSTSNHHDMPDEINKTYEVNKAHDDIDSISGNVALSAVDILKQLDRVLNARKNAAPDSSYVASLYAKGINKILEKVGEEAVEVIIAAKDLAGHDLASASSSDGIETTAETGILVDDLIYEIADVWFHTLVTLAWFNIGSEQVLEELARRFGLSGIIEKASR